MMKAFVLKLWNWYKGHEGVSDAHHTKYTDTDVVSALEDNEVYLGILDALTVKGDFGIRPATGNAQFRMWPDAGNNWSFGANATSNIFFIYDATNMANRFSISPTGNVGISITTPTALLDINSDVLRLRTSKTPASAGASGNQGDQCWDANYFYVCVSTNSWKRTALSSW